MASVVFCLGVGASVQAAFFSEIFVQGGTHQQPEAVEVAGLTPGQTHQIALIQHNVLFGSTVSGLLNFQSSAGGVMLLADDAWPTTLYDDRALNPQILVLADLDTLGLNGGWQLAAKHELVLLNQPFYTGLSEPYDASAIQTAGVAIQDALMLADHAESDPIQNSQLLAGQNLSRPLDGLHGPMAIWLGGAASATGVLEGTSNYHLTPGDVNDLWVNAIPEPHSVTLFVLLGAFILRRHGRTTRCGFS